MATKLSAAKLAERMAFQSLVKAVAERLETGEPTVFRFEAELRHHLRSSWCLEGMRWCKADEKAEAVILLAFRFLKAVRPTWLEGQQITKGTLFCANESCAVALRIDAQSVYCSETCRNVQSSRVWERRQAPQKLRLRERLANERWAAKQEPRLCPGCEQLFQPRFRDKPDYTQKYCDHHCYILDRKKQAAARKAEKAAMRSARRLRPPSPPRPNGNTSCTPSRV
jgi:hypothetical protein